MLRRSFLALASVSTVAVIAGCTEAPVTSSLSPHPSGTTPPPVSPTPTPTSTVTTAVPHLAKVPAPHGTITALPGHGNLLAWTVDDGTSSDVVKKYAEFSKATGTRLTFFLNGKNPSWTENAALLRPLVESGQIQLGNHTWDHPALTKLSDAGVVSELQRNHDFIRNTYGVDARPFFRPPFGYHDARTDRLAASIGYTTPVLWYGSLSDSGLITPDQVVGFADQWFLPGHIVIGHANYEPVTTVFEKLDHLVHSRGLQTVTLNDVYSHA